MELSILIPVRNYRCDQLLKELQRQMAALSNPCELLLGDDASDEEFALLYRQFEQQGLCKLIRSEENLGAGAMRNLLASQACGRYCLVMDSDTLPALPSFLANYLSAANEQSVVCGGFLYPQAVPPKAFRLRYYYGHKVESKTVETRAKRPYDAFVSMCFLIPTRLFLEVGFHPQVGMGYEDALFGKQLQVQGIPLRHIDNPVLHSLKESSEEFLATTERYIQNLFLHRDKFVGAVKLLHVYFKLWCLPAGKLWGRLFPVLQPALKRQLSSAYPCLKLFALYKLLFLAHLHRCAGYPPLNIGAK